VAEAPEIRTDRLLLRQFRGRDVDDVFSYSPDPAYGRFIPVPRPYELHHAEEFVAQAILRPASDPMWAIVHDGHVCGAIELDVDKLNARGEIHYAIARNLWRQGVTTEAARAVLRYAFEELHLRRIFARADVRNTGSWRVMEKLGMKREGVLRSNRVVGDESVDDMLYAILRDEFS